MVKNLKKIIDQMKNFQNKNYKIALLGAGGHAGVCLDILKIHKKEPICLITPEITKKITSYPKITDKEFLKKFKPNEVKLVNGIGMVPGNNRNLRKDLYKEYTRLGYKFTNLVHPSAVLSKSVVIHDSVQIMAGCIIQNNVVLEQNTIINTGCIIEHNCVIGKNSHIAPGSILCGNVKINSNVFLPAGSIIKQNSEINSKP